MTSSDILGSQKQLMNRFCPDIEQLLWPQNLENLVRLKTGQEQTTGNALLTQVLSFGAGISL